MPTVAFFGSHPLGEACLDRLVDHDDITVELVVTYPPDHEAWWDGSVNDRATTHDLTVEPVANERALLDADVDYLLSVYYPNILGADLLDHPTEAALNLHQAELPRYRGSNVFSHSIMNARDDDHWMHGTTMHLMDPTVDAGDVVDRNFVPITETDTARDLYERTRLASIRLFEELLPVIVDREVQAMATPQSAYDCQRYFYRKDSLDSLKEISLARLRSAAPTERLALYDRIRALDFPPHEPAWTRIDGNKIYLRATDVETGDPGPLTVSG